MSRRPDTVRHILMMTVQCRTASPVHHVPIACHSRIAIARAIATSIATALTSNMLRSRLTAHVLMF